MLVIPLRTTVLALLALAAVASEPAITLRDARLAVTVLERGGRVVSCVPTGGSELLHRDPEGLTFGWWNPGGDRAWLGPQAGWGARQGSGWPPPKELDHVYTVVQRDESRVHLRSPLLKHFGAIIEREVALTPSGLAITSRLIADATVVPDPLGTFVITMVPAGPLYARLRPGARATLPAGVVALNDQIARFDLPPTSVTWDLDASAFAVVVGDRVLMVASPDARPGARIFRLGPPPEDKGEGEFLELEFFTPDAPRAPGESVAVTTHWTVLPLVGTPEAAATSALLGRD